MLLFVVLLGACGDPPGSPVPQGGEVDDRGGWPIVAEGDLVRIACERRLYERTGSNHFFVRLRVDNRTPHAVGVDLRDYWTVPRPNQWGGLARPRRETIDEERSAPRPLNDDRRRDLLDAWAAGTLLRLEPRQARDVYVEFNASGRGDVDAIEDPHLYVSLDGQLFATDGSRVESLTFVWDHQRQEPSSVILSTPVTWGQVPDRDIVVTSP